MQTRILSLLLCLLLLTGCAASPAPAAEEDAGDTRTLTDGRGRTVTLPEQVESVVCVGVGALRYTTYLGAQDLAVGVEQDERDATLSKPFSYFNRELFDALPLTGDNGATYDEEILTLHPDVLVANLDAQSADDLQSRLGIPVVAIAHNEGIFDENALTTLEVLGQVYHKEERAQELTDYLLDAQADLARRTQDIPQENKPTVYVGGVSYKGHHGFEGTEAGYAPLAAIGAVNLADETGQSGPFNIDTEQVLTWDPDVIFLDYNGMDLIRENYAAAADFYNALTAVQEGRLYAQISFRSSATNAELALADAYYAGTVLYPEAFADVDIGEKFDEIFSTMLGVEDAYAQYTAQGYVFGPMTLEG